MITLKNIQKSYGNKVILKDLSVDFSGKSTIYSILGKSGSGKTTLLNMLFGIDQDFKGEFLLDGKNVKEFSSKDWDTVRNEVMQIVYQDYKLIDDFTVYDNLLFAMNDCRGDVEKTIDDALIKMDLLETKKLPVKQISGGQKQRLAMARACINKQKILLLDEPTGNLDDDSTKNIMEYIKKVSREDGTTIIIITHDTRVLDYVDIVYNLENFTLHKAVNNEAADGDEIKKVDGEEKNINTAVVSKKKKIKRASSLSFVFNSIMTSKKEIILAYIPLVLMFSAFILAFNFIMYTYDEQVNDIYMGLNDKTIILANASKYEEFKKDDDKGIVAHNGRSSGNQYIDGKRIYFSNEDVEKINNIDGVKRADFLGESAQIGYLDAHIPFESFSSELRNTKSFKNYEMGRDVSDGTDLRINFYIQPYYIQHEYSNIYNPSDIEIIKGDFPKAINDIIIPNIYAEYLKEELGVDDDGLINKGIVIKIHDSDPRSDKFTEKSYNISGIYKTDYKNVIETGYNIYTGFNSEGAIPKTEKEWNARYKEFVAIQYTEKNDATKEYMSGITKNLDSYKKAMGEGFSNIIIELDSKEDAANVTAKLNEMTPKYVNVSRYYIDNSGDYTKELNGIYAIYIGLIGLVVIMGLIIAFINKGIMLRRNKKMSILYSLGYSKRNVIKLILLEIGILGAISLGISLICVQVLNSEYLQYTFAYESFENILSPSNVILIILFATLMLLISAIWSLLGINKRKLKKYLEVN